MAKRFVGHDRAKIGTADADVDYVADALAVVAGHGTAAHALAERRHAVENGVDFRYNVFAVDIDVRARQRAQCHM